MVSPRRETDRPDVDYSRQRGDTSSLDSHTRWVIRIISAAMVLALSFFITALINKVDKLEEASSTMASKQAVTDFKLAYMQQTLDETKALVKEMQADVKVIKRNQ